MIREPRGGSSPGLVRRSRDLRTRSAGGGQVERAEGRPRGSKSLPDETALLPAGNLEAPLDRDESVGLVRSRPVSAGAAVDGLADRVARQNRVGAAAPKEPVA